MIPASYLSIPAALLIITLVFSRIEKMNPVLWMGSFPKITPLFFVYLFSGVIGLFFIGVGLDYFATLVNINDTSLVEGTITILQSGGWVIIFLIAFSVIAEETFFRGLAQSKIGLVPSALLFGVMHGGYFSIIEILGAILAGLLLGFLREKTTSIYAGAGAHFVYNAAIIFLL